ncbi:hypothetical protein NBRC116583_23090 [Arenicella sp. 4NH20-0111]|uniref:ParD-like family protein n=1 Tax=Arenicella sp. 4NH20-0111 TaxID=3127648 RepID=UPI003106A732
MGILKISDLLHDEIRHSSKAMSRSINAQAEFWIKVGRLSELNPTLTYQDIVHQYFLTAEHADATLNNQPLPSLRQG